MAELSLPPPSDPENHVIEQIYGAMHDPDRLIDVVDGMAGLVLSGTAQTRLLDHVRRATDLARTGRAKARTRPDGKVLAVLGPDLEPVGQPVGTPLSAPARALAQRALLTRRTQVRIMTKEAPGEAAGDAEGGAYGLMLAIPAGPDRPDQAAAVTLMALARTRAGTQTPALVAAFGLTEAEARVAASIADGKTLVQTARALGLSRETAKTHLERIFDKTGTRKQTILVPLLIQTTLLSDALGEVKGSVADRTQSAAAASAPEITLQTWTHSGGPFAGECVAAHVFGPRSGRPTLLFHSTFMGHSIWPGLTAVAGARGMRIALVLRPGYAPSSPNATDAVSATVRSRLAADACLALDALGWEAADLIGYGGGAAFAFEFAARCPERVARLRAYSPRPIFSATAQAGTPSGLAGAIDVAALSSPEMVAAVSELFASSISESVLKALVEAYYAAGTRDGALLSTPGLLDYLIAQSGYALSRGGRGMINDHALLAEIQTLPPADPRHAARVVLATDDAVNRLAPGDPWLNVTGARCTRLEQASHLDFFVDPGRVLDALEL